MNHKRIHTAAGLPGRFLCLLVVLSLMLGLMGPVQIAGAQGSVTLEGVSSGTADDVSSITVSHTTGTGTDRLMLVGVGWNAANSNSTISTVTFTYDTTELPLTEVITQQRGTQYRWAAIYSLLAPPSGQAGTVTITFSDSVTGGIVAGVANFAGVDQTTPLGTPDGAESSTGEEASVTLTGLNGDELVFDTVWVGGASPPTLSVGADQAELWNTGAGNSSGGASTEQATSGSVTMSWTRDSSGLWAIAAVPINPAATTDPTITITGTPLDPFSSQPGTPSAEQSYTVSGSNLTDDITITPPTDFEISTTSGSGFGTTPVVLTQSGGAVAETDIYVRFSRATTGTSSGDITHTSAGATPRNVAVSGTASPIALDGTVSSNTADDVSTIDISHTTGTGANRLMLVGVSWNCGSTDRTISSVTFTYGTTEVPLTEVRTEQTGTQLRYSALYSLVDPPSGEAGTVTVTFSGDVSNGIVAGVANFAGVDQTTPLGPSNGANGNSTAPSVELTGLDGDELVFDNVFQGASGESQTLAAGSGQTQLWNAWIANTRAAASTKEATSSAVTMSWTAASSSYWAIVAVAINPAPTGTTHTLTVDVVPDEGGTTAPSEGDHVYAEGTVVDVTATANEGYEFDQWGGACTGTDPDVCQVTMDEDKTVTASFTALPQYALAVGTTGNGSVTLDPTGGTYYEGTIVTLTPVADPCHAFSDWSGTDYLDLTDNGDGTWSITMDEAKSVTANFAALPPGTPCYRVNCGGDTLTVPDPDFLALHYPGLDTIPGLTVSNVQDERSTTDTIDMSNVDPGLPMELFQTILIRGTAGQTMSYDFTVPNGDYDVLLHFAEHYFSEAGQRAFDITVEGVLVFDDYDIFVAAGGEDIAVTESVPTTVDDGVLSLDITAQVSDAAIRGIEIVLAEGAVTCYELTLGHTGNGTDPVADLANSTGCPEGQYVEGETINLSGAVADTGWGIASWYGTGDDTSTGATNSVTMPASAHSTGVNYLRLLGDVDLSGDVDSTDALIVLTADAGLPTTAYCPMNYGDVNGDGLVNSSDALIILTYDVELPVGTFLVGQPVVEPVLTEQPPGCLLSSGGFSGWSWGLKP